MHFGKGSTDKSSYPPVEEFYYSSKPERYGRQMSGTPAKLTNCNPERSVRESADMTPKKVRIDESNEERAN